jgi:Flp pilus assembly protein TadG
MSYRRCLARARRKVRQLQNDERGISAVEFAMLLPLMVTLYLGGVEVSEAVAVDRKTTMVARTVGDLIAQTTNVTTDDVNNIFAAATAVLEPYNAANLKVTVSSIKIDAQGVAKIVWSDKKNGGAADPERKPGDTVTLNAALNTKGTWLIWAEAKYEYTPTIGYVITKMIPLTDQIYMRPRQSDCVTRTGVVTTCS